jgi:acetyl-CoA C-acetyltransferase
MTDVAIVGIGISPFGRHEGMSGLAQGAAAVRHALDDAGLPWSDVQFATGGSQDAGKADTMVNVLGLTGLPFFNVENACATGGSSLGVACSLIGSGAHDLGVVVGFDKHRRGAFDPDPADWGLGAWYGETGLMLTTQFFAMKIQRYLNDHGLSSGILAKVAAKAYRNGALNPNAWRRRPLTEAEIEGSTMLSHPLTQYMFCSPGEGGVALVVCRAELASRYTSKPVYIRSAAVRSRRFGSFEVFSSWLAPERTPSPSVEAARAAFEGAGIGPEDVDIAQLQDTESGAEVMHMAETGLCKDGEQEALLASSATELDGMLPINTDGGCIANGEPVGASGLRQIYESVLQLRGDAGDHPVPSAPTVPHPPVSGAPAVSACTVRSTSTRL